MVVSIPGTRTQRIVAGLVAGLVAGVVIDVFLVVASAVQYGLPVPFMFGATHMFVAGVVQGHPGAMGPLALGLLAHFAVAAAWGAGYGYLVDQRPQVLVRPLVSGLAYGVVVWFCMQLVLMAGHAYTPPKTQLQLATNLVAHIVFFGPPVALVTAVLLRRRA